MSLMKPFWLGQGPAPARSYRADAETGAAPAATRKPPLTSSKSTRKANGKAKGRSDDKGAAKAAGKFIEGEAVVIADDNAPESASPENPAPNPDAREREQTGAATGDGAASSANAPNPLASAVALMAASPRHRHLFIGDLEWALMPPIALKQFRIFAQDSRPLAYASWAFVSDEVEARFKTGVTKLKPNEWKSGDRCWLIDLVAPMAGAAAFIKLLQDSVLKDQTVSLSGAVQVAVKEGAQRAEAQAQQDEEKA